MTGIAVYATLMVLIVGGTLAAGIRDWLRFRAATEPIPLSHPSMKPALQRFRDGDMPCHEDAPLTPGEEDMFAAIAAAEHDWIGQAVRGRREGEQA